MKFIWPIFLYFFLCTTLWSQDDKFRITKCLGIEEKLLHEQKDLGPNYQLNQMLLSIFLNLNDVTLEDKYFQQLCQPAQIGTSLELLDLIFHHYEKMFRWSSHVKKAIAPQASHLEELFSKLPELFNQYLLSVNIKSPTPNCLSESIPELKNFQMELQYLGQDILFRTIADKDKQLLKILAGIKKKDLLFSQCAEKSKAGSSSP